MAYDLVLLANNLVPSANDLVPLADDVLSLNEVLFLLLDSRHQSAQDLFLLADDRRLFVFDLFLLVEDLFPRVADPFLLVENLFLFAKVLGQRAAILFPLTDELCQQTETLSPLKAVGSRLSDVLCWLVKVLGALEEDLVMLANELCRLSEDLRSWSNDLFQRSTVIFQQKEAVSLLNVEKSVPSTIAAPATDGFSLGQMALRLEAKELFEEAERSCSQRSTGVGVDYVPAIRLIGKGAISSHAFQTISQSTTESHTAGRRRPAHASAASWKLDGASWAVAGSPLGAGFAQSRGNVDAPSNRRVRAYRSAC